jgi:hypothetical protein
VFRAAALRRRDDDSSDEQADNNCRNSDADPMAHDELARAVWEGVPARPHRHATPVAAQIFAENAATPE